MKGILLASHGKLAEGMLDTINIFSADPEQIEALCLSPGDDMPGFINKIKEAINRLDTGDGVMIFCDLLFGTPCNCSGRLLKDEAYADRITVITGMNLSMVLEYVGSRATGVEPDQLLATGKDGIVDFASVLKSR